MQRLLFKQSGFTLLELLITLTIAGILAGMAIPAFGNTLKRNNSLTIAYQMISLVQLARAEAVTRRIPLTLCGSRDDTVCDKNNPTSFLIFDDANNNRQRDTNETLYHTSAFNGQGTFYFNVSRGADYLRFRPDGGAMEYGNITYCPSDNDAHFSVYWILSAAGRLRLAQDQNNNGIPENAAGQDISC